MADTATAPVNATIRNPKGLNPSDVRDMNKYTKYYNKKQKLIGKLARENALMQVEKSPSKKPKMAASERARLFKKDMWGQSLRTLENYAKLPPAERARTPFKDVAAVGGG